MVYLIHFDEKLAHAGHYIGYTEHDDVAQRYKKHLAGQGSRLLAACNRNGITYDVVRTWPEGDRKLERRLKNQKKAAQLCPVCRAQKNCSPKKPIMNKKVKEQVKIIELATARAVESQKSARKFLRDAGIIRRWEKTPEAYEEYLNYQNYSYDYIEKNYPHLVRNTADRLLAAHGDLGTLMRLNDPIAFRVGYNEWKNLKTV